MSIENRGVQFTPEQPTTPETSPAKRKESADRLEIVKIENPENQGSFRIKLRNKNGETFNLGSLMPKEFSFRQTPEGNNGYQVGRDPETGDRAVLIPPDQFRLRRGEPLTLLHEIGHIYTFNSSSFQEKGLKSFISIAQLGQLLLGIGYKNVGELEIGTSEKQEKHNIYRWYFIPESFIRKYGDLVAQNERNAWAWALWHGRKLKQEGFDVFSEFKSFRDLREWIAARLATYDYEFLKDIGQAENLYTPYSRKVRK